MHVDKTIIILPIDLAYELTLIITFNVEEGTIERTEHDATFVTTDVVGFPVPPQGRVEEQETAVVPCEVVVRQVAGRPNVHHRIVVSTGWQVWKILVDV